MAPGGGLYVPCKLKRFSMEQICSWQDDSYAEIALKIIAPFVGDAIDGERLKEILTRAYSLSNFGGGAQSPAPVRPLTKSDHPEYVLELIHGPTLSFKDYALQVCGHLMEAALDPGQRVLVLGATSGDTGSAGIAGYSGLSNIDIVVLHPYKHVSDVQRKQMTTEQAPNVHNIALKRDYDHCQAAVKSCLADKTLLPDHYMWSTVNSVNWARIMLQVVYYFSAFLKVGAPKDGICFSVPTGNFGNMYAGYLAREMGLPIRKLIAGVNIYSVQDEGKDSHSVLSKFFAEGVYEQHTKDKKYRTLTPSMDIAAPSNLERLLFDVFGRDGNLLRRQLAQWREKGRMRVEGEGLDMLRDGFACHVIDNEDVRSTMKKVHDQDRYILDPHSATGLAAGRRWMESGEYTAGMPVVHIATADPVKFPKAVRQALKRDPEPRKAIEKLSRKKERYEILESGSELRAYLKELPAKRSSNIKTDSESLVAA